MNPPDPQAEAVWEHTLPLIRSTRRNRINRRIAGAGAACCAFAIWFTLQSHETPGNPTVRIEPSPQKTESIAVMRIDENGTVYLEEITSNELGSIDFTFGQTPILHSEWPFQ